MLVGLTWSRHIANQEFTLAFLRGNESLRSCLGRSTNCEQNESRVCAQPGLLFLQGLLAHAPGQNCERTGHGEQEQMNTGLTSASCAIILQSCMVGSSAMASRRFKRKSVLGCKPMRLMKRSSRAFSSFQRSLWSADLCCKASMPDSSSGCKRSRQKTKDNRNASVCVLTAFHGFLPVGIPGARRIALGEGKFQSSTRRAPVGSNSLHTQASFCSGSAQPPARSARHPPVCLRLFPKSATLAVEIPAALLTRTLYCTAVYFDSDPRGTGARAPSSFEGIVRCDPRSR